MRQRSAPRDISVGVDIGGTKVLGVALGSANDLLAEARVPTPKPAHGEGAERAENFAERLVAAVAGVIAEVVSGAAARSVAGVRREELRVGVGAPGMVDRSGTVRLAPNLPGAAGVALGELLAHRFPRLAIVVDNDATCAVRAEHELGSGRGQDELLMVTLGTGIGGGVVQGGVLVHGANGFAGEIGHMVVDPAGPPCPCGGRGCWERYASGGGLGRLARDRAAAGLLPHVVEVAGGDPEAVRGEHVTRTAALGDADAIKVLEELGWWLGLGLANLVAILDPACIVVGGGLADAGEMLLGPARRAFAGLVEGGSVRSPVPIVAASFGERAGAVGAALAARAS